MTITWNEGQSAAIATRGTNLLVAAGAGAGKTAVLVERVVRWVTGPQATDITRLLVVTFTEAAAAEMRLRVSQLLHERSAQDPRALRQAALLGQASISTLHAFCLKLIRRYFYRLGLDPQFSVMGEEESALLRQELYAQLLEGALATDAGELAELLEMYGGSGGQALEALVLRILNFARSHPDPTGWLTRARTAFSAPFPGSLGDSLWGQALLEQAWMQLQLGQLHLREALTLAEAPEGPGAYALVLAGDLAQLQDWLDAAGQWSAFRARTAGGFAWKRLPSVRGEAGSPDLKQACQEARQEAKGVLKGLEQGIWARDDATLWSELNHLAEPMGCLTQLVQQLAVLYQKTKSERGQLDFADLEHYCLQLLVEVDAAGIWQPSSIAREMRQQYAEVLVDEYQDINAVQDAILALVSRQGEEHPNLFMVGDVKQSIYRFRLADPGLFLSRQRRYAQADTALGRRIELVDNYRSAQEILDGVNFLFRAWMCGGVAEVAYSDGAELVRARQAPDAGAPVEFHLLERRGPPVEEEDEMDSGESLEREAYLAARLIQQLVAGEEALILPGKDGSGRRASYRDVVILMRATRQRANQVIEVLSRLGVPAHAQLGTGYFAAQEVAVMRSLLQLVDNPRQDIPLAAVLRSPVVGVSAQELAGIRLAAPDQDFYTAVQATALGEDPLGRRLREFLARLEAWRSWARRRPINQLVWRVLHETGYYDHCAGLPGGAQRQANLRALYERARQFDQFSHPGLFRFLRFLERLEEEHDLGQAPSLSEQEDVVRILSIHKSKGLEFPVVLLLDAGKQFNLQDLGEDVLLHRELGLGPKVVDPQGRVKYPSAAHAACAHRLRAESLAEELRVLYVALTRAQERLFIIGSARDIPALCRRWSRGVQGGEALNQARVLTARTWLDWLGPRLMEHPDGDPLRAQVEVTVETVARDASRWRVQLHPALTALSWKPGGAPAGEEAERLRALETLPVLDHDPWRDAVRTRLGWGYAHRGATRLAAKLSVSELKRRYAEPEEAVPLFAATGAAREPRFLTGVSPQDAALRGTAVHTLLGQLTLVDPMTEAHLTQEVDRLVAQELIREDWRESVSLPALMWFFSSPVGRRLLAQRQGVRREVPFTLRLPTQELAPDDPLGDEWVTLQGVMDCYFPAGDGLVLLDYKTDAQGQSTPQLAQHLRQLALYRRALEAATGQRVSQSYLVFLATQELVAPAAAPDLPREV